MILIVRRNNNIVTHCMVVVVVVVVRQTRSSCRTSLQDTQVFVGDRVKLVGGYLWLLATILRSRLKSVSWFSFCEMVYWRVETLKSE